jgi:excisionase family DNA binding protein
VNDPNDLFSTEDAARYLAVDVRTIRYHVYESGHLVGELVGRSRVFRRSELDRFKEARDRGDIRPGRKSKPE